MMETELELVEAQEEASQGEGESPSPDDQADATEAPQQTLEEPSEGEEETSPIELTASRREAFGKERVKKLRQQGLMPGNIYGQGLEGAVAIQLDYTDTYRKLHRWQGEPIYLTLEGKRYRVEVKEVRKDPVSREWLHLDLYSLGEE